MTKTENDRRWQCEPEEPGDDFLSVDWGADAPHNEENSDDAT